MKVVISGASSGLGFAFAKALGERGDAVYSLDIQSCPVNLKGVTNIEADVAEPKSVRAGLAKVGSGIDVLVNNAGVMRRGALLDSSVEDFDLLFRVNVKGSWVLLKEAYPFLADKPTIIQMSSGYVLNPKSNPGVYIWTKQITSVLVDNLSRDYPHFDVKATYLGPVDTPMSAVGRTAEQMEQEKKIMHPADYVAGKMVQLLDSDSKKLVFDEDSWDYRIE